MTGEEPFTGNANAGEQKVDRTSKTLANRDRAAAIFYTSANRIASRSGSLPNQR
jgi:hypothetical protein